MIVIKYLSLQLKRSAKLFAVVLIFSLLLSSLFAFLCVNIGGFENEDNSMSKIPVGIVGDLNNKYLKIGLRMINSIDASNDYIELISFEKEEEAVKAVEDGKIIGYAYISKEFMQGVIHGNNSPIVYVAKDGTVDLSHALVNEVVSTIGHLLTGSQSGIFSIEKFFEEQLGINTTSKYDYTLSMRYAYNITDRDTFAEVTQLGSTGETSMSGYYFCSCFIILTMLIGVLCANHLIKKNTSLSKLLSTKRCFSAYQVLCDFLGYIIIPLVTFFAIFVFLGIFLSGKNVGIPEISGLQFVDYISFYVSMIPAILVICSMQFFIYELCSEIVSGALLQFLISVSLAYLSGCFYPASFFPEAVQKIISAFPVGVAFEYIKSILVFVKNNELALLCLAYTFFFVALSVLVRSLKIRSRVS